MAMLTRSRRRARPARRRAAAWRPRAGLTPAGLTVALMGVLAWVPARLVGGRAAYLLAYGTVIALLLARVQAGRRVAVDAERSRLPGRARVGQLVSVELALVARRRVNNLVVEEDLPSTLGGPVRIPVHRLVGQRELRHVYSFVPRHRGVHRVGPVVATWGDPFGLTRRSRTLIDAAELIVHPVVEPARDRVLARAWEDPPIRPPVSKPWPSGFEFHGLRDYTPGDDPRRIVWRATARADTSAEGLDRILVREAEQGISDRVTFLLDTDRDVHDPGVPSDSFEHAVRVVASMADRHLHDGLAVTVETNGARLAGPLRGERDRLALLDELARVECEPAKLTAAVQRLARQSHRDQHHVVVTTALDRATAAGLELVVGRGAFVLVALVGDGQDDVSVRHAVAIGCAVVQLRPGAPIGAALSRIVGGGAHRPQGIPTAAARPTRSVAP